MNSIDKLQGLRFRQIHLDFHTAEMIPGIGEQFDAEEFAETLQKAGVDSITCFARCHHGYIYYQNTKFPAKHPNLSCDLLTEQIKACHKRGIRVPIYVTVGWDEYMAKRHPEWLQRDDQGKPIWAGPFKDGWKFLCYNTEYIDYVVAQTEEVLDVYGSECDGLFFDICLQMPCCCYKCIADMQAKGLKPENVADRTAFSREVMNNFKARMTAAIRAKNSECTIFYNAGHVGAGMRDSLGNYSHLELESLPSGGWGYEHFPTTARYARKLGFEFLGMTGKFHKSWADFGGFKNHAALQYECFLSMALGGKVSVGDQLHPNGKINQATYELVGSVFNEMAIKEPWCVGAEWLTEIAVLSPEAVDGGRRYELTQSAMGANRILTEAQAQFDFVDYDMDLSRYKLLICPDLIRMNEREAGVIDAYVAAGGKLLLTGESGLAMESCESHLKCLPATVKGTAPFSPNYLKVEPLIGQGVYDTEHIMYDGGLELQQIEGTQVLAAVWNPYFNRNWEHFSSHAQTPAEKPAGYPGAVASGNVAMIGYPVFSMYRQHGNRFYKQLVHNIIELLAPKSDWLLRSNLPTSADITLNRQPDEDRYVLHLLHYPHTRKCEAIDVIEDVLPLYDVQIEVKLPAGYDCVTTAPEGVAVPAERCGDYLRISLPKMLGHQMLSISRK